jgi:hypothetical protein
MDLADGPLDSEDSIFILNIRPYSFIQSQSIWPKAHGEGLWGIGQKYLYTINTIKITVRAIFRIKNTLELFLESKLLLELFLESKILLELFLE